MVSRLTDWWYAVIIEQLTLKTWSYRYCRLFGHINTPPYDFKDIDMGWPRCRRCKITMIPDEHLPQDIWIDREKYFVG